MVKKLKVYISYFLLFVFAWVITPTHSIHDIFADHEDTPDNYCLVNHAHLGVHVEEQHVHCDILKLNTPVYDIPVFDNVVEYKSVINTVIANYYEATFVSFPYSHLPSRAPPALA